MSHASQPAGTPPPKSSHGTGPGRGTGQNSGWAVGGVVFAGILMVCSGVLAILQGIAAIAEDDVYGRVGTYVYRINLTGWGWIHLIIGVCVLITGYGLLKNMSWARYAGIFFASLSLVAQFLFLPYLPIWAVIVIAIDVFIIWALAAYSPDDGRDFV
ncbi:DUF7144 family membrane protein [Streptomyces katsurahamanus]|uniref:DUF7144 domain-containing protein n=1 Tax=Streptomyces katsurahamanus TaxID=2577098 RepID=A0ABW9NQ56_9ACTN|nr:hypothetical protein [Streptomyces katsurahamanus]MQS35418.1 hypothetical protein [Streptomyces katsurahamanus]